MPLYEQVLVQLASFNLTEAEGELVRSRVKWADEGETSSHFFLRLEKKRGTESWISAMCVSIGVAVTDVEGICESWASFYQDLFTACPVDLGVQSDLLDCLSFSLSVDDVASCDGPISANEAHTALLGMPKGKSAGSDGLPMEFYVAFWDLLGEDLVHVSNASLEAGLLPFSQRVFLSVVGVRLPRSPLLAILWSSWLCFCLSVCLFVCFFASVCASSLSLLSSPGRLRWLYCGFLGL